VPYRVVAALSPCIGNRALSGIGDSIDCPGISAGISRTFRTKATIILLLHFQVIQGIRYD
jgi:hypothetical protein